MDVIAKLVKYIQQRHERNRKTMLNDYGYSETQGILKYSYSMLFLVVLNLGILVFLTVILLNGTMPNTTEDIFYAVLSFAFFILGTVFMLGEVFGVKGTFNENEISYTTPWTGTKQQQLHNVNSVTYNKWCYWYLLAFNDGTKIRISVYVNGHGYLIDLLKQQGHNVQ